MTQAIESDIGRHPAFVGILLTCCGIAVLLNLLAIVAVVKFGRRRTSIDIFISNLAGSDIIHAGIVTPLYFKNVTAYDKNFNGGNFVCKVTMFIPLLTIVGGTLTIVAIAIDRCRMFSGKKQQTTGRQALFVAAFIWLMAFLISSPQFYEYSVYEDTEDEHPNQTYTSCGSEDIVENFEPIYAACVVTMAFLVPVLTVAYCYTKIMIHVWNCSRRLRASRIVQAVAGTSNDDVSIPTKKMVSKEKIQKLKMLILITITFVTLWTPYFILFAVTEIMGTDDTANFLEWPHVVSRAMTVMSTISNPLIYLGCSKSCRQAFYDILTCSSNQDPHVGQTQSDPSNKVAPSNENWNSNAYEMTSVIKLNI